MFSHNAAQIQSTPVISNSKGLSEILRDNRTSTNQFCIIEEKLIRLSTFNKCMCNWTLEVKIYIEKPASVAHLDAPSDWRPRGRGFKHRRGRQHSFVEIDHEIFSTVILSLPLIQKGQLSVFWRKDVHNTG